MVVYRQVLLRMVLSHLQRETNSMVRDSVTLITWNQQAAQDYTTLLHLAKNKTIDFLTYFITTADLQWNMLYKKYLSGHCELLLYVFLPQGVTVNEEQLDILALLFYSSLTFEGPTWRLTENSDFK